MCVSIRLQYLLWVLGWFPVGEVTLRSGDFRTSIQPIRAELWRKLRTDANQRVNPKPRSVDRDPMDKSQTVRTV